MPGGYDIPETAKSSAPMTVRALTSTKTAWQGPMGCDLILEKKNCSCSFDFWFLAPFRTLEHSGVKASATSAARPA